MKPAIYEHKPEPGSSHDLLQKRLSSLPAGSRVLDVGAATGLLGRMLAGSGLHLYGIEPDPGWAEQARPFYEAVFAGGLDDAPGEFLAPYDAVVCADVLEHLPDPQRALDRLAALQQPGTRFLISVPNAAHLYVRLMLLLGRFDYAERGILDRTHLRFFTRKTARKLVAAAGLRLESIEPTPVPLGLVRPCFRKTAPGRLAQAALYRLTRLFPTLLGYQFFCLAIKP